MVRAAGGAGVASAQVTPAWRRKEAGYTAHSQPAPPASKPLAFPSQRLLLLPPPSPPPLRRRTRSPAPACLQAAVPAHILPVLRPGLLRPGAGGRHSWRGAAPPHLRGRHTGHVWVQPHGPGRRGAGACGAWGAGPGVWGVAGLRVEGCLATDWHTCCCTCDVATLWQGPRAQVCGCSSACRFPANQAPATACPRSFRRNPAAVFCTHTPQAGHVAALYGTAACFRVEGAAFLLAALLMLPLALATAHRGAASSR